MTKEILQEKIVSNIISIHEALSSVKNLIPSPIVNREFTKLVSIVDNSNSNNSETDDSREILSNSKIEPIIKDIRLFSSKGESELEAFWAKKILKSDDPEVTMSYFPYYSNYKKMTEFEVGGMFACDIHKRHKILFVGSGPLPLSSIMMAKIHGITVHNLDSSEEAVRISKKVVSALGLNKMIKIIKGNILDFKDLAEYDGVFVAALVGKDEEEKLKIIRYVSSHCNKDTHIILRSVTNLGTLLYPEITAKCLDELSVVKIFDQPKGVINNIIVCKKK